MREVQVHPLHPSPCSLRQVWMHRPPSFRLKFQRGVGPAGRSRQRVPHLALHWHVFTALMCRGVFPEGGAERLGLRASEAQGKWVKNIPATSKVVTITFLGLCMGAALAKNGRCPAPQVPACSWGCLVHSLVRLRKALDSPPTMIEAFVDSHPFL